jgi:hypothetical protein
MICLFCCCMCSHIHEFASLFSFFSFFLCSEVRGLQSGLNIMDEAAYIDEDFFFNVILPLFSNEYCANIAITTPGNDLNWFSFLHELKDKRTGKLIFRTFFAGTACRACRAAGRPEECTHKKMPAWKDQASIDKIKAILHSRPDIFNREIQGVVTSDQTKMFTQFIRRWKTLPRHTFRYPPALIWSFVDPGGAGKGSDYAVVSMAFEAEKCIVSRCCCCCFCCEGSESTGRIRSRSRPVIIDRLSLSMRTGHVPA